MKMNKTNVAWMKTSSSLIVNVNGQTHTFTKDNEYYEDVLKAIKEGKDDLIPDLVDKAKKIKIYSQGHFTATSRHEVKVDGKEVNGLVAERIFEFMKEGLPYEPLLEFVRRVRKNPSFSAQKRLYECLEHNKHPILEDGRFLAYKAVNNNFKDIHTGKIDNSPGTIVKMDRKDVDDDHNRTCSTGLHVASYQYASNFGNTSRKLLDVAVCPSHVVAIPHDYNDQKMRTCEYEVLRLSEGYIEKNYIGQKDNLDDDYEDYSDDYDEDDYEYYEDKDCEYCDRELDNCQC